MNEEELDGILASANPIDRDAVASQLHNGVGEDVILRSITEGQLSLRQRLQDSFGELAAPGWGRLGFVGVLFLLVVSFLAISPGSSEQEAADADVIPASTLEVSVPIDPMGDGQRSPDSPTTTEAPESTRTELSVTQTSEGSSSSEDPATEDPQEPTGSVAAGNPPSDVCSGSGSTSSEATQAHRQACGTQASADCAESNGQWVCVDQPESGGSGQQAAPPAPTPTPSPTPSPTPTRTPVSGSECILIEAESFDLVGAWSTQGDSDAGGGRYIVWSGLGFEQNNGSPEDVIRTSITVTSPGTYRFLWAMRQPSDVRIEEANDSWLNFPDAGRFGPVGGGSYGGFVKVYGQSRVSFGWTAIADERPGQSDIAIEFNQAGTYTVELAGRSHGHQIDQLLIYRDSLSPSDAVNGRCDQSDLSPRSQAPEPAPTSPAPAASGPFDTARDLLSLHFDHAGSRDDGHATVADKVLVDTYGVAHWVVGGTYGTNRDNYQSESEAVMNATWGSRWVNADADWNDAVSETANRWQRTLDGGGDVWVAEGGQSDLTADVVRELNRRNQGLSSQSRIHVVQHSGLNIDKTTTSDMNYVAGYTDFIQIDDGNYFNDTADLNTVTPGWESQALSSQWRSAWDAAFEYLDPDDRLDFSDTVAVLHILGIPRSDVASPSDFADRYFG